MTAGTSGDLPGGEVADLLMNLPGGAPELVEAARVHLTGQADPLGAAVVARMARSEVPSADGWIAEHGVAFAVRAVLGSLRVGLNGDGSPFVDDDPLDGKHWDPADAVRLRTILDGADEAVRAEAAEVLKGLRPNGSRERIVAAYLLPHQTAWVDGMVAEVASAVDPWPTTRLGALARIGWLALTTPGQVKAFDLNATEWALEEPGVLDALCGTLGDGVVPFLHDKLHGYILAGLRRRIAQALADMDSDAAFDVLIRHWDDSAKVTVAFDHAMKRFPERAARLLGPAAAGSAALRVKLRRHLLAHPELLASDLPEQTRAVAAELSERAPAARIEDLPEILVSPPWTRKRRRAQRTVLDLVAVDEPALYWAPGEREEWARTNRPRRWNDLPTRADFVRGELRFRQERAYALLAPEEEVRPLLQGWRVSVSWNPHWYLAALLARFGLDFLPQIKHAVTEHSIRAADLLQPVVDLETARLMADWAVRLKSVRAPAWRWLRRHTPDAVRLLVPDAVGPAGKVRQNAETVLRGLPADQVRAGAAAYGPEAAAAVEAILAADPLDVLPSRMPVPGDWAAHLPQIMIGTTGTALPDEAARHVLLMLALSKDEPYAGLAAVKEFCGADRVADFAWAVFEAWNLAGRPAKDGWALTALGAAGDNGTVRRLTPYINAWRAGNALKTADTGLGVLAGIGSAIALVQLDAFAKKGRSKALRDRAKARLAEVAARLELTADELADRLVPDFGLQADGSAVLDYGPRRFTVGFDEQLRPYVLDEAGKRRKDLPPPGSKDDPELAPAAKRRFAELKKDVKTIAADRIERFESAMVSQRAWSAAEFRDLFAAHPLLRHVARRLVWTSQKTSFRIAEDGTLADLDDALFELPDDAEVRIAHPLLLGQNAATWAELFADYEIVQPFPQLGRAISALTEEEAADTALRRFAGATVHTGRIFGLLRRGWERGVTVSHGCAFSVSRRLPSGRYAVIAIEPGIYSTYSGFQPEQTIVSVGVRDDPDGSETGRSLGDELDPVNASELINDLTGLVNP